MKNKKILLKKYIFLQNLHRKLLAKQLSNKNKLKLILKSLFYFFNPMDFPKADGSEAFL